MSLVSSVNKLKWRLLPPSDFGSDMQDLPFRNNFLGWGLHFDDEGVRLYYRSIHFLIYISGHALFASLVEANLNMRFVI